MAHILGELGPWSTGSKAGSSWQKRVAEQSSVYVGPEAELGTVLERKGPGTNIDFKARPQTYSEGSPAVP